MPYLLAVNRSHRGKLPKDATPGQWAAFNDAFVTCELSPQEIADEIRAGHAIAAVHDGRRKRANWQLCQHIGIDLDDGSLDWDDVVNHPLVEQYAAIVHTTASHRPDAPRMRVLFLLEEPIEDADTYASIVGCFLRAFSTADPLCKDASRLFFGAPDCSLLLMPDNRLTEEDLANIATAWPPLEDDAPRAIGFKVPAAGDTFPTFGSVSDTCQTFQAGDIVPPCDLSPTRKAAHLAALMYKIRTAPDGKKWETLRDVSITLGGYARAGYLSTEEARAQLQGAIETRRATVASMAAAYATIDDGLAYGSLRPLYYERGDKEQGAPNTARRHDLRSQLIAARLAELESMIKAAPDDAPDFADMVAEYTHLMGAHGARTEKHADMEGYR
jgi:hypothetical protein